MVIPAKTILVTGASGYLAGRIIERLAQEKEKYKIILGARDLSKLERIELYNQFSKVHFDIGMPETFEMALKGVDTVIHLAALNFQECERSPELAQRNNVEMVERLLSTFAASGGKTFLYMSTIHIYGAPLEGHIDEKKLPDPKSIYSSTHYQAENKVREAVEKYRIKGIVFRLSNALGAPLHSQVNAWDLVANNLCRQAIEHNELVLKTPGIQKRNFVSIRYVSDSVVRILSQDVDNFDVFNLGGNDTYSILEIATKIQESYTKLFGKKITLSAPPLKDEKAEEIFFSSDKLAKLLGTPEVRVEDEVDNLLSFCHKFFKVKN